MYLYNSAYEKYLKENLTDDVLKDICNKIKELDRFNYGINDVKVVCRGMLILNYTEITIN
ncbi:hypothetical protein [Brachyspira hyodysenteriae]|uniref:hypothetical protein n=1 Tax=Brachyspira hyodysenteriae TaxID=159 RepID=UPI0022CDCF6E|nr:hypothetical protein [Brachyspira hyodysenteriae]MCZ9889667.1 hypothetical protein [Brachyspira hyodysenteriae]